MTKTISALQSCACLVLLFAGLCNASKNQAIFQDYSKDCVDPSYTTRLLSKDPLVIYIHDFVTPKEALHLEKITKDRFTKSEVADESGNQLNATTRNSKSATPPRDAVVRCIENRALAFQGSDTPRSHLEPLQLVRYSQGENYEHHTDWFEAASKATDEVGGNRLTSFFVYLTAEKITGGGTNFPLLGAPKDESWCKYVNCDEPWENGVTFRPIPGNAVFWQNLQRDGNGHRGTLHAGLPLTNGTKLGMNIWTRERSISPEIRGEDIA